jgi:uncharacterized protein (TIGR00369 family)
MTSANERSAAPERVNYVPGGPEALFHVGEFEERAGAATGQMLIGPWTLGPTGRPALGSLGVLVDVVFGAAAVAHRPAGWWAVTTEIQLDAGGALPELGSRLSAAGRTVHHDASGALAKGTVTDERGRVVLVGTVRVRYTPGTPIGANRLPPDSEVPTDRPILELLNVTRAADGLELATTVRISNPMGIFHGGVALCLADIAGRSAVQSDQDPLATASLHITYVRPGPITGTVRIVAHAAHRGRTLAAAHVRCLRPDGKPFALATITYQ